jgi:hypothetical protein
MIAAPWYLLAAGISLVIVGALVAAANPGSPPPKKRMSEKMSNKEIVRSLNQRGPVSIAGFIILLGLGCVLASVVWRLGRWLM